MTTPPSIELDNVHKSFRTKAPGQPPVHAVRGIDLSVSPGEVVAFLGPNGAGKTTTLDMVIGLTTPDRGTARVFGADPRQAVLAGQVSAVLQTGGLLRDLTVRETVRLIASTFAEHQPVDSVLERADLRGIAKRKVSKCSGGEQQRLRFALALLPDPDLLILDEPTTGMDVGVRRGFWDAIQADADAGRTVLFATHYLHEAEQFAQRIVMVAGGRVVADGSMAEIRASYADRTVSVDVPAGLAGQELHAWVRTVSALPGVREWTVSGGRIRLEADAGDSDALAHHLLRDHAARNLEITGVDLESAFVELTGQPADGVAPGGSTAELLSESA